MKAALAVIKGNLPAQFSCENVLQEARSESRTSRRFDFRPTLYAPIQEKNSIGFEGCRPTYVDVPVLPGQGAVFGCIRRQFVNSERAAANAAIRA